MFQRPAKMQKSDLGTNDMKCYKAMKLAAECLNGSGYEDEAFYFEQLVDWLSNGRTLPLDKKDMESALGL